MENGIYGAEVILGVVLVPYFSWITISIFNLRTEHALLKLQMKQTREEMRFLEKLERKIQTVDEP